MKQTISHRVTPRWMAAQVAAAVLATIPSSAALEVIDPTGTLYTGVSASSEFDPGTYGGTKLFDTDITGVLEGEKLSGGDWARVGGAPAFVTFELDQAYTVGSIYYAQRAGSNPFSDKITRMSVWTSTGSAFAAADPGTPPATVVAVNETGGAIWREYLLTNNIAGRYFLVKVEQDPLVAQPNNIGGNELRLGLAVLGDPPAVTKSPVGRSYYTGTTARLSVRVTGTAPMTFEWKRGNAVLRNDNRISGADTKDLVIAAISADDAGAYTCAVRNGSGSVTSEAAAVSVLETPRTGVAAAVLASKPVGYWRCDDGANPTMLADYYAEHDGAYGTASATGVAGPRPVAFPGFGTANTAFQTTGYTAESAAALPGLALNTNTVTILAWVNPQGAQQPYTGIVFNRNVGTTAGLILNSDGTQLGYQWNSSRFDFNSGLVVPTEQWSLVGLVVTPSEATLYLGNGNTVQARQDLANQPIQAFAGNTMIGLDTDVGEPDRTFNGYIDDVAIFNRALSQAEVEAIYAAAVGTVHATPVEFGSKPMSQTVLVGEPLELTAPLTGSEPIAFQWFKDDHSISVATNRIYSVGKATVADAGAYYLVAANSANRATSVVAQVTVLNEAIEVLSPSGAAYAGISANSEYPGGGYEAANLFKTDVTGLALGSTIGGADWAEEGTQPAYVAFELAQDNKVRAAYYAQRTGADPSLDKITKMSVWTSSSAAFDPLNPPTDEPAASVQITDNGGAVWRRYLLPQVVTGRYFLIKVEQDPQAGGNIGGHELRLGVLVESKRLEYGRSQAGLTLTWSSGTLQQADDATGPWQAATDITPGVAIPTNGARRFYRVKY